MTDQDGKDTAKHLQEQAQTVNCVRRATSTSRRSFCSPTTG